MRKYATLFLNISSANGFNITNVPWVGYEKQSKTPLYSSITGHLNVVNGEIQKIDNFIDLGLPSGTLWSTKNLGATNGETAESWYGNQYAWGEIETKDDYAWDNYKFGKLEIAGGEGLTKYNNEDEMTLEPEDDAAKAVNPSWSIPSESQVIELLHNTQTTWESNYQGIEGLNGRLFFKLNNIQAAFKNIPLYTIFNNKMLQTEPHEINQYTWAIVSQYTLDETIALFRIDMRPYIFKDITCQEVAEYGVDYALKSGQPDYSTSMFIPNYSCYWCSDLMPDLNYTCGNSFSVGSSDFPPILNDLLQERCNDNDIRPVITSAS